MAALNASACRVHVGEVAGVKVDDHPLLAEMLGRLPGFVFIGCQLERRRGITELEFDFHLFLLVLGPRRAGRSEQTKNGPNGATRELNVNMTDLVGRCGKSKLRVALRR